MDTRTRSAALRAALSVEIALVADHPTVEVPPMVEAPPSVVVVAAAVTAGPSARCSRRPAPSAARRLWFRSSPAATSPCTARIAISLLRATAGKTPQRGPSFGRGLFLCARFRSFVPCWSHFITTIGVLAPWPRPSLPIEPSAGSVPLETIARHDRKGRGKGRVAR